MAVRTGMADLILRLRRDVDAAGTAVWTDQELQNTLDAHKMRVWREPLEAERTLLSTTAYEYRVFHSRFGNYESGGTAYFNVEDSAGSQRGTATYTADYLAGVVTMTADQAGTALYLTGHSYDMAGAASELWRERAGKVASYYDVSTGGKSLSRSQWRAACLELSKEFASQARAVTVRQWTNGVFGND